MTGATVGFGEEQGSTGDLAIEQEEETYRHRSWSDSKLLSDSEVEGGTPRGQGWNKSFGGFRRLTESVGTSSSESTSANEEEEEETMAVARLLKFKAPPVFFWKTRRGRGGLVGQVRGGWGLQ